MFDQFRKIYDLLGQHERRRGLIVLVLIFFLGLSEVLGVASLMPFIAVATNPEVIETNPYLSWLYTSLGFSVQHEFLVFIGMLVFVVLVGTLLFSAFTYWVICRFTQSCNYHLSSRLFERYLFRPYLWFLGRHSSELGKSVLTEVNVVVNRSIMPALNILSRGIVVLFLLVLVVLVDPLVALSAAVVLGGAYGLIFVAVRGYLVRIGSSVQANNSQRFKIAQEGLSGIKDVKVAGLESTLVRRYRVPAERFAHLQARQMVVSDIPRYVLEAIAFGGMIVIMLVLLITRPGGLGEALPLVTLYAFAGYRLLPALQQLYLNAASMKFGTRFLDDLHQEMQSLEGMDGAVSVANPARGDRFCMQKGIRLRDVSFSYPTASRLALSNLSLEIKANTRVGVIGSSGAGKTTLIDVILGLVEPQSGALMVDDEQIVAGNRRKWQASLGYVPQQIFLIDDTVAANIAFGEDPDAIDYAAVERAARMASLHDFVIEELADGYKSHIGERGVRLSGGQRQRIGIARALYHDPSILIFDEATSALDNITERAVMSAVEKIGSSKTIIIIAHRLSTIRSCDRIFLMDEGRLAAAGTYDELSTSSALFAEMSQASG